MKLRLPISRRMAGLIAVLMPLLAVFAYVALRSGPLAPVPVVTSSVQAQSVEPMLFGIGAVEARYTYRIGPTLPGRVLRVDVQVGDVVTAGQVLGEMDPVDLDDRMRGQQAEIKRAEANVLAAQSQVTDAQARREFAVGQMRRYDELVKVHAVSEESAEAKREESKVAEANLSAARANLNASREELVRARAEYEMLRRQRANLELVAPVAGLVAARHVDPGTTVVAGQAVVDVIDPTSLWINARFDQLHTAGLRAGLRATVVLRSRPGESLRGSVLRIEPVADAVTEELLAKIVLEDPLPSLPPIGELVEVTVALPAGRVMPTVSDASVQRVDGELGVWVVNDSRLKFTPVKLGLRDLEGRVPVLAGLSEGEQVVRYSHRALHENARIKVVERLPGLSK